MTTRRGNGSVLLPWVPVLLALVLIGGTAASAQDQGSAVAAERRDLLDAIREDLVSLRFEKALAAIEALLGQPGMTEAERAEALILRVQAHVAFGDLDAAEDDYREILRMRPGYVPEVSLTPAKAMERYRKVRGEMVGVIRLTLDPGDARLSVDGVEAVPSPEGLVPLLSGEHVLRAERAGHDPVQEPVVIEAGKEIPLKLQLMPNARTVVLRTQPEDVEVVLDGVSIGRTARPETLVPGQQAAELIIENLPLGEHQFELRKECYRTERLKDVLTVDLLDRSPKRYKPVTLVPASSTLAVSGGPSGAVVSVDGDSAGRLPLDPVTVCPGERDIEVRFAGRVIWSSRERFDEAEETRARVVHRPNAALVGADEWPPGFSAFGEQFSTTAGVALPGGADLSDMTGWSDVELPPDTDVALAVIPAAREGAADRWYLYSPMLKAVARLDGAPVSLDRPSWSALRWGFSVLDSASGGAALVVRVSEAGPAATAGLAPGDRIVAVGGREVSGAVDVLTTLGAASEGRPIALQWRTPAGETRQAELQGNRTPVIGTAEDGPERSMARAAWALVDSLCDPDEAPAALANLAMLFSRFGHHDLAADTWRRVRWGDRAGVGEGTKQYFLGRELELLGQEEEAIAAYRRAAASAATVFHDEGPRVAPAARDRLADLGVSVAAD